MICNAESTGQKKHGELHSAVSCFLPNHVTVIITRRIYIVQDRTERVAIRRENFVSLVWAAVCDLHATQRTVPQPHINV